MCLQSCAKFISQHVSYVFHAFYNIISIITPTTNQPSTLNYLDSQMFC